VSARNRFELARPRAGFWRAIVETTSSALFHAEERTLALGEVNCPVKVFRIDVVDR
jgi:hypothetical protein